MERPFMHVAACSPPAARLHNEGKLMTSVIPRLCSLVLVMTAVTRCQAADEPLTRVQIVKAGKAATALVEVKGQQGEGYGSAFCVQPDGWFVTNAHVAVGGLTLVLNPNLKNEKSYPAVVRTDKEADLALLKVEGVTGLPSLSVGSDEGLAELTEVMGFGYPLTKVAGREITVSVGRITALRHKDGKLEKIQLDAALTRGSSGGPVLDKDGKVIGVVVSGIVATGLNFAIPVSVVSRFLARPEVQFDPPPLTPDSLHKPVKFEARVAHLIPSAASLTVELILKAGKAPERTLRMDAQGDRYRVTAVPIPEPTGPWTLRLAARFDNATLEATTTERSLTIGGQVVKLSEVRSIFLSSPSRVVLRSGLTLTGALAGLESVPVRLSGQSMSVDLASAKDVNVSPVAEADKVEGTLVVRQGEREVCRQVRGLIRDDLTRIVEVGHFTGHQGHVEIALVSPDGRRILSGSGDKTMILWDRETGRQIRRFKDHGGQVMSVAFSPDGRRALSGSEDRLIRLWDLESGAVIREFRGHTEWVMSLAYSPEGRLAYSTSGGFHGKVTWQDGADSAIRVWDVETGHQVGKMEGHKGIVFSVAVSNDGRKILSGGDTIILWDAETRTEIRRLRGHTNKVHSVALIPDGQRAVSSSWDGTIRLWDIETGQELHCFHSPASGYNWIAVSPDGLRLLSSSWAGHEVRLWDIERRKELDRVALGSPNPIRIFFTPDGTQAVCGCTDGVRIYQLQPAESGTSDNVNGPARPDISGRWFCSGRGPCSITPAQVRAPTTSKMSRVRPSPTDDSCLTQRSTRGG